MVAGGAGNDVGLQVTFVCRNDYVILKPDDFRDYRVPFKATVGDFSRGT